MLTIISVSYKSKALLDMNYQLVKTLNPDTPFRWIVVQNTQVDEIESELAMDDPRFEMILGVVVSKSERENIYEYSFHHAKALNLAISYTDSDLILTLDPDCFLFMPNWIELITDHVKNEKIVFFGAPHHPDFYTHYQGFPTAICMLINRKQLNQENRFILDFMPDVEHRLYKYSFYRAISEHYTYKRLIAFFFTSRRKPPLKMWDLPLLLREFFKKKNPHLFSNISRDTGYLIYKKYQSSLKYETLQVYAVDKRNSWAKFLGSVFPNTHCIFSGKAPGITKSSSFLFKDFGESFYQFFWKGQLLAVHIHRSRYSETGKVSIEEQLLKRAQEFLAEYI